MVKIDLELDWVGEFWEFGLVWLLVFLQLQVDNKSCL